MKYLKRITLWFIVLATASAFGAQTKRYEVKSGIIEYAISSGGEMMDVKIQTNGTSKTVFKEWGNIEVQSSASETTTMGQKQSERELTKLENGKVYVVDFNRKLIYEYSPQILANSEYRDLTQNGKEIMENIGGTKIAEEDFMGYPCEVWQIMQSKLWLYKGVLLKSQSEMMGFKHTLEATKIQFDISVPDEQFELPAYQIKQADMETMLNEGEEDDSTGLTPEQIEQMKEMTKEDSEDEEENIPLRREQMKQAPQEDDEEEEDESPQLTPEQMEQMKELMNNFGKI